MLEKESAMVGKKDISNNELRIESDAEENASRFSGKRFLGVTFHLHYNSFNRSFNYQQNISYFILFYIPICIMIHFVLEYLSFRETGIKSKKRKTNIIYLAVIGLDWAGTNI